MKTETFVRLWQDADNVAEVVAVTGTTEAAARSRASYLRKQGVPLKKFGRGRPPLDLARLNAVAKGASR